MTAEQLKALRRALETDVADDYADDPDKRRKLGGADYKQDVNKQYKSAGVLLDSDVPKPAGRDWAALGKTGALAGLGVLQGVVSAFRGGMALGGAASELVKGLGGAITGVASGLSHVGETVLSAVLAPFGKGGQALAGLAGGAVNGLIGLLSGAVNVAAAGAKIGVGLAGGIIAGAGSLAGAGVGGILGAIIGTVVPGAGTVAGAVVGAGIGGAVAGAVLSALTGIVGIVSSGLGQALGAVGSAFGAVGKSISTALGSVQNVLSDLIDTGQKFAAAAMAVQRGSGFSLGASSQVAGLSQVLTGGPGAFGGTFSNMGMMGQYLPGRAMAFGEQASGTNFLQYVGRMFDRYQSYGNGPNGALQKEILLKVAFPGSESTVGGLFSLGPDMVAKALRTAQQIAPSAREVRQDARLGMDLSVIQAQLDGIKLKLLSDLMPTINLFVGAFSRLFSANEGKILAGLQGFGQWLFVKFPSAVETAARALFGFAESFVQALPKAFAIGLTVIESFLTTVQKIAGELAGPVGLLSKTAGAQLSAFSKTSLQQMGLETPESQSQLDMANRRRSQADAVDQKIHDINMQLMGQGNQLVTPGHGMGDATSAATGDRRKELEAKRAALQADKDRISAEADNYEAQARAANPFLKDVGKWSAGADKWLQNANDKSQDWMQGAWGTEAQRQKALAYGGQPPSSGRLQVDLHLSGEQTVKHEIDLERMRHTFTEHLDKRDFRAFQRSN